MSEPATNPSPAAQVPQQKLSRTKAGGAKGLVKGIVRRAKRLNRVSAVHGETHILDNALFPWVPALEAATPRIRAELDRLLLRKDELPAFHEVVPDTSTITRDQRWKTYGFLAYGARSEHAIRDCPETWKALQGVAGLRSAMFSILDPGKHIPAHKGPYNGVLRVHLGLIIPEPRERVTLRVVDKLVHWREGQVLIFDDSFEHEVWNDTDGVRVVLFLDIEKPLRFPANIVNRTLLSLAPFTPLVREVEAQQTAWEKRFYGPR